MAEAAEAVARLSLDAKGFDRQAKQSLESFTKQLRSVQDATDVVIAGAEQLQKRFVKSLGGVAVIGLANALGDAMRDVGSKIGAAGQAAADAQSGIKGLSNSFAEGAARAEKMQAAAAGVAKSLEELNNFTSIKGLVFKSFGGEQTLTNLQSSLQGAADAETMAGAIRGRDRARATAGMTPDQVKDYDLQQSRKAQIDAAKKLGPDYRDKTVAALQATFALEDAAAAQAKQDAAEKTAQEQERKYLTDLAKAEMDASQFERLQKEQKAKETAAAQEKYLENQYDQARKASRRDDENTRNYYTLVQQTDQTSRNLRQKQDEFAAGGLAASRRGQQFLQDARERQAELNRIDNFKFAEEQVQAYVDRMRTRGRGQSNEDFERYSNLADDAARQAARRDLARQQAARENPSMRDQATEALHDIKNLLDANLRDLKTFAHAS